MSGGDDSLALLQETEIRTFSNRILSILSRPFRFQCKLVVHIGHVKESAVAEMAALKNII